MKAVILAGGTGTRLKPYTTIFPKPLMPVGQRPILEIVINKLAEAGITDLILAVGYLAELINAFFNDGSRFNVHIQYLREENPLGTAGALGLLHKDLTETFLVMNGDVLTTVDLKEMIKFHKNSHAAATVGVTKRSVKIDLGTIELSEDQKVLAYHEKPTLEYLVSMGVYIFEPEVACLIEPNQRIDLPDLIRMLCQKGSLVKGFLHQGYWLDIGRIEDYEIANKDFPL